MEKKARRIRDGDYLYIGCRSRGTPNAYVLFKHQMLYIHGRDEGGMEDRRNIMMFESTGERDLVQITREPPPDSEGKERRSSSLRSGDVVVFSTENGDVVTCNSSGSLILGARDGSHTWVLRKKDKHSTIRYGDTVILSPPGDENQRWCSRDFLCLGSASLSSIHLEPSDHVLPPPPPKKLPPKQKLPRTPEGVPSLIVTIFLFLLFGILVFYLLKHMSRKAKDPVLS